PGAQCYDFLRQTCSDVIATGASGHSSGTPMSSRRSHGAPCTGWSRSRLPGTTTRLSSGAMCDKRRPGCALRSSGACCGNRSSDFFVHHVTVLCSITTLAKQTEKEDSAMLPALHNPARAVLLAALLGGSALSVPTAVRAQSVTP